MKFASAVTIATCVLLGGIAHAQTINILSTSGTGLFLSPAGDRLPDTAVLHFGIFNTTAFAALPTPLQNDPTAVFDLFTSLGSENFNSGQIVRSGRPISGGTAGDKLFVFVSTDPILDQTSAFGVFSSTNSLWDYPREAVASATLSTRLIDQAFVGFLSNDSNNLFLSAVENATVVIPEPSFLAFLLPAGALAFGAMRRRR